MNKTVRNIIMALLLVLGIYLVVAYVAERESDLLVKATSEKGFMDVLDLEALAMTDEDALLEYSETQIKIESDGSAEAAIAFKKKYSVEKDDLTETIEKNIDTALEKEMDSKVRTLLEGYGNVSLKKVEVKDEKIFFLLESKHVHYLTGSLVGGINEAFTGSDFYHEVAREIAVVQTDYILQELKMPEIVKIEEITDNLEYEMDKLDLIEVSESALAERQAFYDEYDGLKTAYRDEVKLLSDELEALIMESSDSELETLAEDAVERAYSGVTALNEVYGAKMEEAFGNFMHLWYVRQGDDIEQAYSILYEYFDMDVAILSKEQMMDAFDHLDVMVYMPVGSKHKLRVVVDGSVLYKYLDNGQLNYKESFSYNTSSSGNNGVKVKDSGVKAVFFFSDSALGAREFFLGLELLVIVLLIVGLFRNRFGLTLKYMLLVLISAIVLYPILWIIGSSFNPNSDLLSVGISPFPEEFSVLQYRRLFQTTEFGSWYANTLKIAIINMILSVSLTVSTAYVFSRFKFKGKKPMLMTVLVLQVFPSFLGMIAIYTLLSRITFFSELTGTKNLLDTHFGLILVYAAGQIPYNTWLVKGFFDTIPFSLDEAARIDGANYFQAFFKIILPLGRPIISFLAVTNFMMPWMDFIFPRMILTTPSKKNLAVGLYELINGQANNNFTMFAAGAVLVAVPITALFTYFQKFIVTGLSSGAVKG